jgi:hypothetical protein
MCSTFQRRREEKILRALADGEERSEVNMLALTNIAPGKLYGDLWRMEDAGVLTSRWAAYTRNGGCVGPILYRRNAGSLE